MEVKLVRIEQYSGDKAIFYSVIVDGEDETLFEKFLKENIGSFKDVSNMITSALKDKDIYLKENGTFSGNLLLED